MDQSLAFNPIQSNPIQPSLPALFTLALHMLTAGHARPVAVPRHTYLQHLSATSCHSLACLYLYLQLLSQHHCTTPPPSLRALRATNRGIERRKRAMQANAACQARLHQQPVIHMRPVAPPSQSKPQIVQLGAQHCCCAQRAQAARHCHEEENGVHQSQAFSATISQQGGIPVDASLPF